jgi:hypothetical protein
MELRKGAHSRNWNPHGSLALLAKTKDMGREAGTAKNSAGLAR